METLEFYVVRNKEGKYLRSKGYGGYGTSWVDDLKKAKVYNKRQGATGQITWWFSNFPDYGCPELIPLTATMGEPIPQEERVLKSIWKKELEKPKRDLTQAQKDVDKAQKMVDDIKSGGTERGLKFLETKYKGIEEKLKALETGWPWKQ